MYLIDFDTKAMRREDYDVVIIGSGIAGVYTSLLIPEKYNILILKRFGSSTLNPKTNPTAKTGSPRSSHYVSAFK